MIGLQKIIVLPILLLSLISLSLFGCSQTTITSQSDNPEKAMASEAWLNAELTDAATGKTFKISDFKGTPVLLESFAVWCPTCTKQQKNLKQLHEEIGDAVVSISLDTDPNEDTGKVKEHIEANGFDWLYAVSPVGVTRALIDQFGVGIVNAPSAPVVLICEDQSVRFLQMGVKSVEELKEELDKGC